MGTEKVKNDVKFNGVTIVDLGLRLFVYIYI
jgi:hypothetical protein